MCSSSESLPTSVSTPIHITESVNNQSTMTTKTTSSEPQRVRRRVSFQSTEIVGISASEVLEEEYNDLWYQHSELVQFKDAARNLCRQIRRSEIVEDQPLLDTRIDLALETENSCARGLESRISMERQRNKFLATRAIVRSQERSVNPDQLAALASKCTAWAKEVALCTGYQDFYQVYNPTMVHLVPNTMSTTFPFQARDKRQNDSNSPSESSSYSKNPTPKRRRFTGQDNGMTS
mmetsp:Transcript_11317/g.12632  ORF Transcript_11317/g.12632 Transcript_11317/m.12632 type:complete len:235 (-) Transcript_11317:104-808(-)